MTRAEKLDLIDTLAQALNETPARSRKLVRKAMGAIAADVSFEDAVAIDRARAAAGLPPVSALVAEGG